MAVIIKEPIYRMQDERFIMALCRDNHLENFINVYFINGSDEDVKSLRVKGIHCSWGNDVRDDKVLSVVEHHYGYIAPGGFLLLMEINVLQCLWDEYILSLKIRTGKEKVIGECTFYKGNISSGAFDNYIYAIDKRGRILPLETRSFVFTT